MREALHVHIVQVEFYTLEYAESLGASRQTWPLAAQYLAWCPVHGRSNLIRLLEGLPLASSPESMAVKAIQASQLCASCNPMWLRTSHRGCHEPGLLPGCTLVNARPCQASPEDALQGLTDCG